MKNTLIILLAMLAWACNPKTSVQSAKKTSMDTVQKTEDIGGTKDEHGCLTAAGYSWSVLKNDCIKVFEQNKLLPENNTETYTSAAFFLFNSDKTQAELFLPKEKNSIVLERTGTEGSYIWKKDDFELFATKGYSLNKNGKLIYHCE